jgi:hypothetical protein
MLEEDLRTKIASDAGIAALVAKPSIAWGDRPEASAMPGITLQKIVDARPQHMQGFQDLRGTQVQADVWSLDALEARNVKEALVDAVVPNAIIGGTRFDRSFVIHGASSTEENDAKQIIYRERIDFTVWHAPTP